ncbi:uncharacterized protein LOC127442894 isoform X4 [Myxocyprinus asiaticus]|uniref:uncharacterized protein LOC127442894 isoform X4 n=1 Tax=Myxocyprinus asiaticus TaxID=70543 RepID=UPI0022219ACE|nr:uncharacterized protein LOC127442894 isoform X4 [Myxocyprinus asiaticus]
MSSTCKCQLGRRMSDHLGVVDPWPADHMEFIKEEFKEESEDVSISEPFRLKNEDTEEQRGIRYTPTQSGVACGASGIWNNAPTSITGHQSWKYPGSPQLQQTGPGFAPTAANSSTWGEERRETEGTGGLTNPSAQVASLGVETPHFQGVGTGQEEGEWKEGGEKGEREKKPGAHRHLDTCHLISSPVSSGRRRTAH